jgi:hypothetical protein
MNKEMDLVEKEFEFEEGVSLQLSAISKEESMA